MKQDFVVGDKVNSISHGSGAVHLITNDQTYPVIIKFDRYKIVNYYYTQEGVNNVNQDDIITK